MNPSLKLSSSYAVTNMLISVVCLISLLEAASSANAVSWYDEIGPHFGPNVPSSAQGPVYYRFEFAGAPQIWNDCGLGLTVVQAITTEYAEVNGIPQFDRGTAEEIGHGVEPQCQGETWAWHCKQDYDAFASPPYNPNSDSGLCDYASGDFYTSVLNEVSGAVNSPSVQLLTTTNSGTNACGGVWTIKYTYPAETPIFYTFSRVSCSCGGGTMYPTAFGWGQYYKIEVWLEVCATPGSLPGLPGPVGGGGGDEQGGQAAHAKRISAGWGHSLAARLDGTVWAWGDNYAGQLGNGTTTDSSSATQVSNLSGVTSVSANGWHSLALKSDGTVWAWGYNYYGQLGDNSTVNRTTPVQVVGLTDVMAISAGAYSSYAVKSNGTVWAWGNNWSGALGDGTTTQRLTPVQVSSLTGVTAVSGGDSFCLALKSDGTVRSWGYNGNGQLGDGTTTARLTSVQVSSLTGAVEVSAGGKHSLALKSDGTIRAWGLNDYGQLGDGTTTQRLTPVQTSSISAVTGISAHWQHSLAVKAAGTVHGWGRNNAGQLGDGTTTTRLTPVTTSGLTGMSAVAAGSTHSLSVKGTDATLRAWGGNGDGQLGDGTTTQRLTPVTVVGFGL